MGGGGTQRLSWETIPKVVGSDDMGSEVGEL